MYGWGHKEDLLGRALAGRRDQIVLITKFGQVKNPDGGGNLVDGRPEYVISCCETSLKRLNTDVIDLYFQHRIDPKVPIEETFGAVAQLIDQGKVRYIGLSEAAEDTVRRAQATHPITALQTEFSLWSRDVESHMLPLTAELGIGFVAYSPLGRGIFGGAINGAESLAEGDRRRDHPRYQGENLAHNLKLVEPVRDLASAKGCSPAQIALAWLLARGEHVVAIPGTQRIDHLEANAAAADIILGSEEVAQLDAAIPPGAAEGTRYPAGQMAVIHR